MTWNLGGAESFFKKKINRRRVELVKNLNLPITQLIQEMFSQFFFKIKGFLYKTKN